VLVPGIDDLLQVIDDQLFRLTDDVIRKSSPFRELNVRREPELRRAVRMRNMDVHPYLLAREEKERDGPLRKTVGVMRQDTE